jgi:hypothetical protein
MSKANVPAFPIVTSAGFGTAPGLTKREYFAAVALQGLLAFEPASINVIVPDAVEYADALLAALERKPE